MFVCASVPVSHDVLSCPSSDFRVAGGKSGRRSAWLTGPRIPQRTQAGCRRHRDAPSAGVLAAPPAWVPGCRHPRAAAARIADDAPRPGREGDMQVGADDCGAGRCFESFREGNVGKSRAGLMLVCLCNHSLGCLSNVLSNPDHPSPASLDNRPLMKDHYQSLVKTSDSPSYAS